jgi:hypothetical protein
MGPYHCQFLLQFYHTSRKSYLSVMFLYLGWNVWYTTIVVIL